MRTNSRARVRKNAKINRDLYQEVFAPRPAQGRPSNANLKDLAASENHALHEEPKIQGATSHTERFTCQLRRCQEKNEQNGLKSGTFFVCRQVAADEDRYATS